MGNLLRDGAAWLHSQRAAHLGSLITYTQGSNRVSLTAFKHLTEVEVDRGDGMIIQSERLDWAIKAVELLAAGIREPTGGDSIVEVDGSRMLTYEVMAIGSEEVFRYLDTHRQNVLVYSRLVKEE